MIHQLQIDLRPFKESINLRQLEGKRFVFDPIRKKWLVLQPEELVRQLFIQYLLFEQNISTKRMSVEVMIEVNNLSKRYDLAVTNKAGDFVFLLECKSFKEQINTRTFAQLGVYNSVLNAPYLCISNGSQHYLAQVNKENKNISFHQTFPFLNL